MEVVHRRVAGLDVHKKTVVACVRILSDAGAPQTSVRTFGTMTGDLRMLADWLSAQEVSHVVMESTGVYWKPVFNLLEERFTLLLANAHHVKQVPGRKTDAKDCEWLAQLLQFGLVRGSFIPPLWQREMRDLTRTRRKIVQERSSVSNRIQKILEDANVKLSSVASDTLGKSGQAILHAILDRETDPEALADLAVGKLRAKIPHLRRALEGLVTDHHRFLLGLQLQRYAELTSHVEALDDRLLELTKPEGSLVEEDPPNLHLFPDDGDDDPPPAAPTSRKRRRKRSSTRTPGPPPNPPAATDPCSVMSPNRAISLLVTVPGISWRIAQSVVAEIGTDMSRFPSASHLASWAGLSPGNYESAGKRKSGRTTKGNVWLQSDLVQAAWAAVRTKGSYPQAQYRRLSPRRGAKRAIVAVAHSLLVAIYAMFSRGEAYHDLGGDYFDRRDEERLTRRLVTRLEALGNTVTVEKNTEAA